MILSITEIVETNLGTGDIHKYYRIKQMLNNKYYNLARIARKHKKIDLMIKLILQAPVNIVETTSSSLNHTKLGITAQELRKYLSHSIIK